MKNNSSNKIFEKVLKKCLAIEDEKVLIIGDRGIDNHQAANIFTNNFIHACEQLGIRHEVYIQKTKDRGDPADKELIKRLKALPKRSVAIVNVSNRLGTMKSLGYSFRSFMKEKQHRFTSASSLGSLHLNNIPDFIDALDINYTSITRESKRIKKILDLGREVELTSKSGTELVIGIEDMKGRISTGLYKEPGTGGNLPGAESYIAPAKKQVNGKVVIDGSIRLKTGSMLVESEDGVELDVKEGSIIRINSSPEAKRLSATLKWAEDNSKHPWGVRRIGELGIGLNPKAKIVGATILDEKVRGTAHIAIGSNHWFGGSIYSIIHLDHVIRNAKIKVDGKRLHIPRIQANSR